jgi:hypothetical protein
MPDENNDKLERMIELLEEMLKWMKVTSIPQVKNLLLDILPSDKEKIAYQHSDGQDSEKVAQFTGVGHATISRWWKTWIRAGIADSVSARGGERARHAFSLEDFGIEVPQTKEIKPEKKEAKVPINETQPKESQEVSTTKESVVEREKTEEST